MPDFNVNMKKFVKDAGSTLQHQITRAVQVKFSNKTKFSKFFWIDRKKNSNMKKIMDFFLLLLRKCNVNFLFI